MIRPHHHGAACFNVSGTDWPRERRRACLDWADEVVSGLRIVPGEARAAFAVALASARNSVEAG